MKKKSRKYQKQFSTNQNFGICNPLRPRLQAAKPSMTELLFVYGNVQLIDIYELGVAFTIQRHRGSFEITDPRYMLSQQADVGANLPCIWIIKLIEICRTTSCSYDEHVLCIVICPLPLPGSTCKDVVVLWAIPQMHTGPQNEKGKGCLFWEWHFCSLRKRQRVHTMNCLSIRRLTLKQFTAGLSISPFPSFYTGTRPTRHIITAIIAATLAAIRIWRGTSRVLYSWWYLNRRHF